MAGIKDELSGLKKPKRAHFKITGAYFTDNNIRRSPIASINVYYENDGEVTAKNVVTYGDRFYVLKYVKGLESSDQAWDDFAKKVSPIHELGVGPSLGQGGGGHYSAYHEPLSEAEIKKLTSGELAIFVVGQGRYDDDAGNHTANYCRWLQPLKDNPDLYRNPVWHWCDRHNEQD